MRMNLSIGLLLLVSSSWTTKALSSSGSIPPKPPSPNASSQSPPLSTTTTGTTPTTNNNDNQDTQHPPPSSHPFPTRVPVAIVGGGLGGLAVCVALRSQGIDAHIFESSPTLVGRGSTGTGIMISKNGWMALESISGSGTAVGDGQETTNDDDSSRRLVEEMRSFGSVITNQTIYKSDPQGVIEKTFSMGATDQYNIGWTRAHTVLLGCVPPEVIHCGCHFESYQPATTNADTNTNNPKPTTNAVDITFQDGRTVQSSFLIGADGAGSAIRRFMTNKNAKTPTAAASSYETQYAGQLLWNAIIPSRDIGLIDGEKIHGPGEVKYTLCGNDGQVILAFDAGEEQTSWYLTLKEDAILNPSNNNKNNDSPALTQLRTALQTKTFGGFGRPNSRTQLTQLFAPWPVAVQCLAATPESQIFERRLADRPPLMKWADQTEGEGGGFSRVVLMGDAAHPMIPSQGQGTMVAWEDAADLAACVGPVLQLEEEMGGGGGGGGGGAVAAAVDEFVARRAKRCARVQRFSAKSYMGNQLPTFPPKKILRMLWMKRNMEHMKNGYEPKEIVTPVSSSEGGRVTKRSRLLKLFGVVRK